MSTITISDELMERVSAFSSSAGMTPEATVANALSIYLRTPHAPPPPLDYYKDWTPEELAEEENERRATRRIGQRAAKWIDDAWQ